MSVLDGVSVRGDARSNNNYDKSIETNRYWPRRRRLSAHAATKAARV